MLPRDAPKKVELLAKRALISIRQAADRQGLIVASIATQPPQGLDWIRDGAYVNRALLAARHPEMVRAHNIRYSELQATFADQPPGGRATPPGNWAMNYYADGVVGGPIPYEIDETGLGIWTLWDYFAATGDDDYLATASVYEAIQRAAQYLTDVCRDPSTGLQCPAPERDNPEPRQTLAGAEAVWLGLGAAARAARARGGEVAEGNAAKWSARQEELGNAIRQVFFDEACSCYTRDYEIGGILLWPVGYLGYRSREAQRQAAANWRHVAAAVRGEADRGRNEAQAVLGNYHVWRRDRDRIRQLKRALTWIARVPTADETGVLGENWMKYPGPNGPVTTMNAQPHVPSQAIFYLAAIRVFGARPYSF